jgi:hypothetical protein
MARRAARGTDAPTPETQAAPIPATPAPAAPAAPAEDPTTAELKQLAALKDQGILSEEEFEAKKKQILGI